MTFKEYIASRAETYMSEKVNVSGQSKDESGDYNWRESGPRLTVLMKLYIKDSLEKSAKFPLINDVNKVIAQNIEQSSQGCDCFLRRLAQGCSNHLPDSSETAGKTARCTWFPHRQAGRKADVERERPVSHSAAALHRRLSGCRTHPTEVTTMFNPIAQTVFDESIERALASPPGELVAASETELSYVAGMAAACPGTRRHHQASSATSPPCASTWRAFACWPKRSAPSALPWLHGHERLRPLA